MNIRVIIYSTEEMPTSSRDSSGITLSDLEKKSRVDKERKLVCSLCSEGKDHQLHNALTVETALQFL